MKKNVGKKSKKAKMIRICDVCEHKSYLVNINDIHKTHTMKAGSGTFYTPSMYGKNAWWGNYICMKVNYMNNHHGRYIFEVTKGGFKRVFNLLKNT